MGWSGARLPVRGRQVGDRLDAKVPEQVDQGGEFGHIRRHKVGPPSELCEEARPRPGVEDQGPVASLNEFADQVAPDHAGPTCHHHPHPVRPLNRCRREGPSRIAHHHGPDLLRGDAYPLKAP